MAFDEHSARSRSGSGGAGVDGSVPAATGGVAGGHVTLNPSALTVEQLARALSVSADVVRRHVRDGAPADFSGRMNLVHYAAWLNARLAQMGREEDGHGD